MPTNPQDYMRAEDPKQQGEQNKSFALSWIYKWGYSTAPIIQLLMGHQGMSWTTGAIRNGWLRKTGATAHERTRVLTLTPKGVAWVEQRRNELYRYSELDPHRISPMTVMHNLLAQRSTIYGLRAGVAKTYRTERQEAVKSRRGEKKPDVVWITESRERIGVEIELNAKWDQRFDAFVSSTVAALSPSADGTPARFHKFIIITTSAAIAARYASAFEPDAQLRIWRGSSKSDFVVDRTIKVPSWIRDQIEFKVVKENGEPLPTQTASVGTDVLSDSPTSMATV